MREIAISTLSQYIEAIERLKQQYPSGLARDNPTQTCFLYRGHCDLQRKMLPSVFRKVRQDVAGRVIENERYLAWNQEKELLEFFMHEASGILHIATDDLLRWAEYAQHYGVPTRFLDWSANPLVALYFACKEQMKEDGLVWLLHANQYMRFSHKQNKAELAFDKKTWFADLLQGRSSFVCPILHKPYYVDDRMGAQSSFFLIWGENQSALEEMFQAEQYHMCLAKEKWDEICDQNRQEQFLFRFYVHAQHKQGLLRELDTVGINEKMIFPGLDGIGRYVEWRYRFDDREAFVQRKQGILQKK